LRLYSLIEIRYPGDGLDVVLAYPRLDHMGGAERVALDIARNFNPVILTAAYEPKMTYPEFKEFDIRILPRSSVEKALFKEKSDRAFGMRFLESRIREDYDVINAHMTPSEFIRANNPRVCWTLHSPYRFAYDLYGYWMKRHSNLGKTGHFLMTEAFKIVEKGIVKKIEKVCPISEVADMRMRKYLNRHDGEIIHPGINPKEFSCNQYGRFFLYASRIVPEKRFTMAIEAFRRFSARNKGWKLVIAGFVQDVNGSYFKELKGQAQGLDIVFMPNLTTEKIRELYSDCYATLFCAIDEDYGLAPLESMASCKPCISVNEGGPKYTVVDGKTGFLVNGADEMALRMDQLAGDIGMTEAFGKAGRARVGERYSTEQFIRKFREALKAVAAGKAPT